MQSRLAFFLVRFPVWNETFILGDLSALEDAGFQIQIFSLFGQSGSFDQPEAKRFEGKVHFPPLKSWSFYWENVKMLLRSVTWRLLVKIFSRTAASPVELFKCLFLFPAAVHFAQMIKRGGVHHIHAGWASYPATMAWIASELTGIPFSFSAHAYDIYKVRSLLKEKIEKARFVVTCAESNRETLEGLAGEPARSKIRVNRHGLDLERFHPAGLETDRGSSPIWRILACGKLAPYKGFQHLITACDLLRRQGHPFFCTIIGEGPEENSLNRQIHRAGLSRHVRILPPMPQCKLAEQFHAVDLFVHPSIVASDGTHDVIPNVLAEAMASGIPVISTNLTGIKELVQHRRNGILVSPGDPKELADAMTFLMQGGRHRTEMIQAAWRTVFEGYNRARNSLGLVETFKSHVPNGR